MVMRVAKTMVTEDMEFELEFKKVPGVRRKQIQAVNYISDFGLEGSLSEVHIVPPIVYQARFGKALEKSYAASIFKHIDGIGR